MPRICEACGHRLRHDLDTDLTAGVLSQGAVARKYHMSRSSVGRHVRNGHVPTPASTPSMAPVPAGSSPETMMRALVDGLLAIDVAKLPVAQRMSVVMQQRLAVEALAKHASPVAQTTGAEAALAAAEVLLDAYDAAMDVLPVEHRQAIGAVIMPRVMAWKQARA